jgi:hypothetical protein
MPLALKKSPQCESGAGEISPDGTVRTPADSSIKRDSRGHVMRLVLMWNMLSCEVWHVTNGLRANIDAQFDGRNSLHFHEPSPQWSQ